MAETRSSILMIDLFDGCYLAESFLNMLERGVFGAVELSFLFDGWLNADGKVLLSTSFCSIS